jgi:hypothetical protein
MEEVLDDPKLNTEEYLQKKTLELLKLDDADLKKIAEAGREKKGKAEEENIKDIRKKHHVA